MQDLTGGLQRMLALRFTLLLLTLPRLTLLRFDILLHGWSPPLRKDSVAGVTPPLVKYCTLRSAPRSAGPEGARFAVSEPGVLAPVLIASQVDVLPLEG